MLTYNYALIMKKFKFLIISLVATTISLILFNIYIDKKYKELIVEKDITSIKHTYNHIIRDRGGLLKDEMRREGDLILLGSSELSSTVDQNPINIFPFKGADYDVSIFGRAHTQTLQHSTILSNIKNLSKDDKIAIIISAQGFEFDVVKGNSSDFIVNFSDLQLYDFLNNDKLSDESKKYYAERAGELLEESGDFTEECIYAKLYAKDTTISNIILNIVKPYYSFKEYMLKTRDKVQSIMVMKNLEDKSDSSILREINWSEEYIKAEEEGKSKVTNNDLYVDDDYYNKYIKDNYDSVKDRWKGKNLLSAPELDDYKLFLQVSKELGVKPLIILMPVNAHYYEHMGWTVDKRTEFYNTMEQMANEYDFDVLNLQNKEYEKYYLSDVMHLGWKGWLNIDEEMYKYFNKK